MDLIKDIYISWANKEGNVNKTETLMNWIKELNKTTHVKITECDINSNSFWFYDDYNGEILNRKRSFFSIVGMRYFNNNHFVKEQPIIIQPEIGYLGIICKKINGVLNFLMQAKIEPGNINCVQISPTIQATKSNFSRVHGGNLPLYFDYFENSSNYNVLYDQIQSEQGSRFYQKRNRNMIMLIEDDIEVFKNFKWMTLGQIKELMRIDNLVNMDTRTVLSGLPLLKINSSIDVKDIYHLFNDKALYKSIYEVSPFVEIPKVYQLMNNYKMFRDTHIAKIPLYELVDWEINQYGVTSKTENNFNVKYYDIEISGREVQKWFQPLFKATGIATFGLLTKVENGVRKFLVKLCDEIGSFDKVELGPSVQWESNHKEYEDNEIDHIFRNNLLLNEKILIDVMLSEEGGRFYHEQNRNIVIEVTDMDFISYLDRYIWVSYSTLNYLVQTNNCINIQLRNLMSLLDI